jgi:uncharacterized protein YbjT (DUF2867 family)
LNPNIMSSPQILILGAAGYIGGEPLPGTVLVDLLKSHPARNIAALVRTDDKQSLLAGLGVNTVIGSVDDTALLSSLVSKADVVFNFAVPFFGGDAAMQTIVNALEERAKTSAVKPVFLQTSGSGSIMYGSDGVAGEDVWKVRYISCDVVTW